LDAVGGRAAAEIDPADVGGVETAGAERRADDDAIVGVAALVHPAGIRAVGVAVDGVNGRGGVKPG